MPLTWSIASVRDHEQLFGEDEALVTSALVHLTMAVGMYEITEANADEFYFRVSTWERLVGHQITAPKYRDTQIKRVFPGDLVRQHAASALGLLRVVDKGYRENDVVVLTCRPYDGTEDTERLDIIDDRDATIELHDGFAPQPITPADILRRVGLHTNASPMTNAQFRKRIMELATENATEKMAYARRTMETADA